MTNMRPVYDMLTAASARRSGHMPGHKGRPPFGAADLYALDTTELPNTDDLYAAEGGLREAMRLYAQAAGAAKTIFLHNGSTAGNHVMLQLYAREGETVLLPRNAHLSAVNACVLGGMRVKWMPVRCTPDAARCGKMFSGGLRRRRIVKGRKSLWMRHMGRISRGATP